MENATARFVYNHPQTTVT